MKVLSSKQSGRRGNVVAVVTRYGQVERSRPVQSKRRTMAQEHARGTFGRIAALWRGLTDDQFAAWNTFARKVKSRPRLGQSGHLTGCQLFTKINYALAMAGLPPLLLPPKVAKFRPNPVGPLTITNQRGVIKLLLSVPTPPADYTFVLGSAPCSSGISFRANYSILGLLPAPENGVCDVTGLYVERFGRPPVGSRVFIRTRQLINGWEDTPKETNACVLKP